MTNGHVTGGVVSAVRDEASIEEEVMLATGCMVCLSVCSNYCCLLCLSVGICLFNNYGSRLFNKHLYSGQYYIESFVVGRGSDS